mmetsp:Transcript_5013/g.6027  ORF Transcript_5013/g.6027 Transcript_5013/m.6027 type:complete len:268 (-) Transcript_5013:430-1233(-)
MSELKNPCQGSTTVHDGNQVYPRLEPKENKYASFKKSCVNLPTQRLPLRNLLDSNMQNDADRKDLTSKLRTGSLLQSLVDQNTSAVKDSPKTDTPHEHMKKEEFKNVNKWRYTHIKRFYSNPILDTFVQKQNSSGRLLLHLVIRNEISEPIEEVAVGCYRPISHSNAMKNEEADSRILWMAFRKSAAEFDTTKVESFLIGTQNTPLESNRAVEHCDIEVVYGNLPPVETAFTTENQLLGRIRDEIDPETDKVFALLELFLQRCQIEL